MIDKMECPAYFHLDCPQIVCKDCPRYELREPQPPENPFNLLVMCDEDRQELTTEIYRIIRAHQKLTRKAIYRKIQESLPDVTPAEIGAAVQSLST